MQIKFVLIISGCKQKHGTKQKNARPVYDSHIPISDTHLKYCNKALFYTTKKGQKKNNSNRDHACPFKIMNLFVY